MTVEQKVKSLAHFINGESVAGKSGRYADVFNSISSEVIAKDATCIKRRSKDTIEIAKKAFPAWKNTSIGKRTEIVPPFPPIIIGTSRRTN